MNISTNKYASKFTEIDYAWLDLEPADIKNLFNPLMNRSIQDIERPDLHLIKIMRDPKYFYFTCKHILNVELLPIQVAILQEMWDKPFPMFIASRGFGKSFLLAVYATLKCLLIPKTKVVIVGSGLRQSKIIYEYMETIWHNAPILKSICGKDDGPRRDVDRCLVRINDSIATAVPVGDGSKIRGLRANILIADEFASMVPQIYETVIGGFAAVSATPVANVKDALRRRKLKEAGLWDEELEEQYVASRHGNQSIITGTADYAFKHFAQYHKRYKSIIESKGDKNKLQDILNGEVPDNFNWRDYCIIRIPYELIPEGFMDDKQVARARATVHNGIYQMEYGAVFTADSEGFFKRSLIESCVTSDTRPIHLPSGPVWFDPMQRGNPDKKYIYGVDPASEIDNFTITVLQLEEDHTRIVYAWSTNRKNFKERLEAKLTTEHDYYAFCARKIRDLMKTFPPLRIGMDSQQGGIAVMEALHDPDKILPGEQFIWPVVVEDDPKDTDTKPGAHIVELVNFASADWTSAANHGLRKDFEDRSLLFPRFDPVTIGLAIEDDKRAYDNGDMSRLYDSLEDCVMEIEELKNELAMIVMTTTTGSNRDRWDTPEIKSPTGKKGRLRKDRYSSLLIANMLARTIARTDAAPAYRNIGGAVGSFAPHQFKQSDEMYEHNGWFSVSPDVCQVVRRI